MPRHPDFSPSVQDIAGNVYSALAHRLATYQGEVYPLHVGDTWMEPAEGCRMEDIRVADQKKEVGRLGTGRIDEARPMAFRQLVCRQRLEPGQPAEFLLGEGDGLGVVRVSDDRFAHGRAP